MQIIAFDFGEKKIGVAVGQTSTNSSSPLQVIFNNHDKVNWNEINALLEESRVNTNWKTSKYGRN